MELKFKATQSATTTAMVMIIFACFLSQVLAQAQQQECMNTLQPCLNYLNSNTRPSESCCQPLDYVIKSMPECLCSLMTIQGSYQAEQAGINITEAQTLPGRCGQHINPLGCVTGTPDTRSKNSVPNSRSFRLRCSSLSVVIVAIILLIMHGL